MKCEWFVGAVTFDTIQLSRIGRDDNEQTLFNDFSIIEKIRNICFSANTNTIMIEALLATNTDVYYSKSKRYYLILDPSLCLLKMLYQYGNIEVQHSIKSYLIRASNIRSQYNTANEEDKVWITSLILGGNDV